MELERTGLHDVDYNWVVHVDTKDSVCQSINRTV